MQGFFILMVGKTC